jgi:hydantoinase/carbamoylase family amidase
MIEPVPIDSDRILQEIETIAGFNESTPDIGYSRPTFSPAWRQARDYVIGQAEAAGCKVRIDAAGNVHARPAAIGWDQKVWLSGSHIDSVPSGGKFDGVVGVVCPLEVLRSAHGAGRILALELIVFAEEEGTTFGIGMIGSRLWANCEAPFAGAADGAFFHQFRNRAGETYFEAGATHGVRRQSLTNERLDPAGYLGLIEIHIEQGPAMWAARIPLSVVTAISGRKQYKVKCISVPNHAGTTPMRFRQDPLLFAARVICGVDELARKHGPAVVATVGRIDCQPNAVNVIPGTVRFTVDVRSPNSETLATYHRELEQLVIKSSTTGFNFTTTEDRPPVQMNAQVIAALQAAAGGEISTTTSGALHDAAILAPLLPTAMLFVASKDGISHNPAEFSRIEDITAAANVLGKLVAES